MRWLDAITDPMDRNLSKLRETVKDRKPAVLQSMGSQRVRHDLMTEQQQQQPPPPKKKRINIVNHSILPHIHRNTRSQSKHGALPRQCSQRLRHNSVIFHFTPESSKKCGFILLFDLCSPRSDLFHLLESFLCV